MFQSTGKPQGIEIVMFQLKDMPQGFKKYWVKYKNDKLVGQNPIKRNNSKISG